MDEVMRKHLSERMRDALTRGDMGELQRAQVDAMCAQMECQEKTAQRVKTLEQYVHDAEQRAQGAKWAAKALLALSSASGGAVALKVIQALLS